MIEDTNFRIDHDAPPNPHGGGGPARHGRGSCADWVGPAAAPQLPRPAQADGPVSAPGIVGTIPATGRPKACPTGAGLTVQRTVIAPVRPVRSRTPSAARAPAASPIAPGHGPPQAAAAPRSDALAARGGASSWITASPRVSRDSHRTDARAETSSRR